jgi:hypothetical protein
LLFHHKFKIHHFSKFVEKCGELKTCGEFLKIMVNSQTFGKKVVNFQAVVNFQKGEFSSCGEFLSCGEFSSCGEFLSCGRFSSCGEFLGVGEFSKKVNF